MNQPNVDELLIQKYFERNLDDDESRRLNERWDESEDFRAAFRDQLDVEYGIRFFGRLEKQPFSVNLDGKHYWANFSRDVPVLSFEEEPSTLQAIDFDRIVELAELQTRRETRTAPAPPPSRWEHAARLLADLPRHMPSQQFVRRLLIALMVLAGIGTLIHELRRSAVRPEAAVATLSGFDHPVWGECLAPINPGDPIRSGWLRLVSGNVGIRLAGGVELAMKGPAELRIDSDRRLYLHSGFISIDSPKLRRQMRISTPNMDVRVLGTAFWIHAGAEQSEIHMLRGKVRVSGKSFETQQLAAGKAFAIETNAVRKNFDAAVDRFLSSKTIDALTPATLKSYEEDEPLSTEPLDRDPDLLVRFDFNRMGREVRNLARHSSISVPKGTLHRCTSVPGRMPGSMAVAIAGTQDYFSFSVPKRMNAMTLAAWIKLDRATGVRKALLMSKGIQPGAVHWIVAGSGRVVLNLNDSKKSNLTGPDVVAPHLLGHWRHLAVTVDQRQGLVSWFLDGRLVETAAYTPKTPFDIGDAFMGQGNTSQFKAVAGGDFACDELRIYQRALNESEIQWLARTGVEPNNFSTIEKGL